MTVRRRAQRRRREDDGPRTGTGDAAAADRDQSPPSPELLRLQALGGNAAVQRLVTDATQLQRQDLEEEEELAGAETQTDEAGPAGAGAVLASMWNAGVLGPLGRALERIEGGTEEDLAEAYREVVMAKDFVFQSGASIRSSFPDAEGAWQAVAEGIQVVMVSLQPHVGVEAPPLGTIGGHLAAVAGAATEFSGVFEG